MRAAVNTTMGVRCFLKVMKGILRSLYIHSYMQTHVDLVCCGAVLPLVAKTASSQCVQHGRRNRKRFRLLVRNAFFVPAITAAHSYFLVMSMLLKITPLPQWDCRSSVPKPVSVTFSK